LFRANNAFLTYLAEIGRGFTQSILKSEEVYSKMNYLMKMCALPVLTNICIAMVIYLFCLIYIIYIVLRLLILDFDTFLFGLYIYTI
jgi:hypothetical protein